MESAFLVIATKPGRPPRNPDRALTRREHPAGLAFESQAHVGWSDDAGLISIGAWQDEPHSAGGARWHVSQLGMTLTTGQLRWRGRPWTPESTWATTLAAELERKSLRDVAAALMGIFAAASFTPAGRGTVLSDPLGYRCIYYGQTNDVFIVSSRAALAATALAGEGERPGRDPIAVAWLAFSTFAIGERTGFESVKVLPPGSAIEFRPGAAPVVEQRAPAWLPTPAMRDASADQLIEMARAGIAESLVTAATFPEGQRTVGLTGGKDSRVLLAAILAEGLTNEFEFQTLGPPHLGDVVIASALAERFALRHRVEFPWNPPTTGYVERAEGFVTATSGMANVWSLRGRGDASGALWVNGLVGEALRNFQFVRDDLETTEDLMRFFSERTGFGRLGLLRPEAEEQCRREAEEVLRGDPSWELPPLDLLHAFYLRNRVRFARLGPLEELHGERRVLPFYCLDALQAAFAIGAEARRSELLHFEIIRRSSDALAKQPFAGPGWQAALIAGRPDAADYRPPTPSGEAPPAAPKKDESWRARIQRKSFETRKDELEEILADRDSRAWEVLDQARAQRALERFSTLGNMERIELYGAVTAALWLANP